MEKNLHPQAVNVNTQKMFDLTASGCNNYNMNLSTRLKEAMKAAGYTQTSLAKKVGMAQQSLYKLISGNSKQSKFLSKIEGVLGVPPGYLLYGKGESVLGAAQPMMAGCPVLSWQNAFNWPENKSQIIKNKSYEPFSRKIILDIDSYVLRIDDHDYESNTEPDAPFFRKGSYIVIDPDKQHKNMDFVIVKKAGNPRLLLRRYIIEDDGYECLRVLKEKHINPIMDLTPDVKICGVVVAHLDILI
jgi:SOS-response transcriptional repressor LexA